MKLFLPLILLLISGFCFGQPKYATSTVNWEKYRDTEHNISILMPKMPTKIAKGQACVRFEATSYYAFADDTVYEFTVYEESNNTSYLCKRVTKFDKNLLVGRIAELNGSDPNDPAVAAAATDKDIVRVRKDNEIRLVIPEMARKRWIELAIHHSKKASLDEQRFFSSLDLNKSKDGIKIGEGAEQTIGDEGVDINQIPVAPVQNDTPVTSPLRIISKPRAVYTDAARTNNVQGAVRLKVTLLRNGSVGSVQVVTGLKYGLTEQAMAAAKRIVFLPKQINGVAVNVVATFDYGFNIY